MKNKTHKNLPKSDRNERLERLSNQALEAILPVEKFLPREDKPDKGVDSSIEVINEDEEFTNFRAQIQLKGTYHQKINVDGSVSFPVETSNIKYLWNNLISIYVLYIEPRKELRFVWLKDEIKRLNKENPIWKTQNEVRLKFFQTLDNETINQIYEQIQKEGVLHRKIKETLINSEEENNLRLEIEQSSLEVIDGNQARQVLAQYGVELLNSGYENFVLEKYDLLSKSEKKNTKFLLLKSRAEGLLGRYRASLDNLGIISSMNGELSPEEKFHFESTENHSSWMLGQITTEQFLEKLQELSTNELVKNSILDRFNFLHFLLMYKEDAVANISNLFDNIEKLKKVAEEILSDESFSQHIKVNVEFSILENELKWLIMEETSLLGEAAIHEQMKMYIPEHWDRKERFPTELKIWFEKSNKLLRKAQNITIKADIAYLQIRLWFHRNQLHQFWSNNTGKEYLLEKDKVEYSIKRLQTIINVYIDYDQNYSIIRAKMLMVEILSLIGESEESEVLRKEINRQANSMSYDALKRLTNFSQHKILFDYSKAEFKENN